MLIRKSPPQYWRATLAVHSLFAPLAACHAHVEIDESVDHVAALMEAAGYDVTVQPFEFLTFISLSPPVLEQVEPPPPGPIANNIMPYSGSGDMTASVTALAETHSGDPNNVIMVGAHLDSVDAGPGIQDNGYGSAAILETALQMAKVKPRNKVRFAWWGIEESGLVGSDFYVFGLSDEERDKIALYLNFDMIGSPNFVRFIYDCDGSAFGLEGPPGSEVIEAFFEDFYAARGLEFEPAEISFRSDYAACFDSGIPFGGLFTGAEGIKTPEQAAIYGGTAGEQYDPCYDILTCW